MANSRKETDTPAHEVGHWLNLGHFEIGLMKEIDKYGMITREAEITIENIQQIINYSIGKTAVDTSTAPEGTVGKTTLTNPQGNKVEGVVELKE